MEKKELYRIEQEKEHLQQAKFENRQSLELADFIKLKTDAEVWDKARPIRIIFWHLRRMLYNRTGMISRCNSI